MANTLKKTFIGLCSPNGLRLNEGRSIMPAVHASGRDENQSLSFDQEDSDPGERFSGEAASRAGAAICARDWFCGRSPNPSKLALLPPEKIFIVYGLQEGGSHINIKDCWPTERMKKVVIHSGACHETRRGVGLRHLNTGRTIANWAAVSRDDEQPYGTTGRNRSIELAKRACEVEFYTDSEYVKNGVSAWLADWKRNGWRTQSRKR